MKIKKIVWVLLVLSLLPSTLYALKTGDKAREINGKWQNTERFQVCYNTIDKRNEKLLKVLVFCYPNDENFANLMPILTALQELSNVKVALVADNDKDVKLFLENNRDFALPIIADRRSSVLYMAGSLIFPKAFIINYENKIIWDGELVDIVNVIKKINSGSFNFKDELKISNELESLQVAMRSGDELKAVSQVEKILAIDPVNPTALRMRLFMLEEQGRVAEAYELLKKQRNKAPEAGGIYLLMLDLMTRYESLKGELTDLAKDIAAIPEVEVQDKLTFAWVLLNNFNYNAAAIKGAYQLLQHLDTQAMNKNELAFYYTISGCYCYKVGSLSTAIEFQQKAFDLLKNQQTEAILNYYLQIQEL